MTVSDLDTKMDVDIAIPNDTHGLHTHLTDHASTLKDPAHPVQPVLVASADSGTPIHSTITSSETTAEPILQDQQLQQSQSTPDKHSTAQPQKVAANKVINTTANIQDELVATIHDIDDDGDEDLYKNRYPSAVFRPQLEDIVMDQDLLDFYEQLKFLVSLSPLKTAQVLYAFSLATEHLSPELEVRKSVLDMNRRAFSFYQENTWFTVDLESNSNLSDDEAYESSDPKFKVLPARHGLFPALQKNPFGYQADSAFYNPYPPYPHLYFAEPPYPYGSNNSERRPQSPGRREVEGDEERERQPRDRERSSRSHRRGTKSSKRRRSRDSESSIRPSGSVTKIRLRTSGYSEQSPKKSRRDPDSPSLSSMDGVRKHHRRSTETGDTSMDPNLRKESDHHRDRERDPEYERERMERRLARKLRKQQARAAERASGDRHKDSTPGQTKFRPFKITLVQSGKSGSSSNAQEAAADGTGNDTSKSSSTWSINMDQNPDNASASSNAAHRSIQPQNSNTTVTNDSSSSSRPAPVNVQAPQPIPRRPKHAHTMQASAPGGQTAPGPLSMDKSDDKLKKGTWTAAEEEILLEAVRGLSSENWHAVAQMVPGRNAKQCMQKWQTDLDPQINRLPWTDAEDEKLVEAYHKYGNSWQQIAKMVETRTWYQCYNRVRAKSVKTKIQQTTGTHPASIANGGIPGGPRPEGSKAGAKRDSDKRKGHHSQSGMAGLASGPSMDSRPQAGPSQPRPSTSNGERSVSSATTSTNDYIRMKGQQMQGVLALGPSQSQGSNSGYRDQSASQSQGPPSSTEKSIPTNPNNDYHRSSSMSSHPQDVSQGSGSKHTPSTPSQPASQPQFLAPQHVHSPQQSSQQHPPQHQSSPYSMQQQQQQQQPLKPVKTEPQQQSATPQSKADGGYWSKFPSIDMC
ncbi:hypothetical protein FBU30_004999 [Linnemannia zychae]|nr:hypothetical protein FBU30_004999 [Linnemannia zychae]